jgi:hypothetical protein
MRVSVFFSIPPYPRMCTHRDAPRWGLLTDVAI